MATFTKYNGQWVVLAGKEAVKGSVISVQKVSGETKLVVVTDVVAHRGGLPLCAFREANGEGRTAQAPARHTCRCAECGRSIGKGVTRFDASGIAGVVCSACARTPSCELSFA